MTSRKKIILLTIPLFFHFMISLAKDYDAELLFQKTEVLFNKGKVTEKNQFEIKINNRGGEKYCKVVIPYSSIFEVKKINAYIKDAYGRKVRKLKRSEISERSSIASYSLYEDDFVKEFVLKHNTYPYTIVYSYEYSYSQYMNLCSWTPVLDNLIPTRKAVLKVSVPVDFPVKYKLENVSEPTIIDEEGFTNYTWEAAYEEVIKKESLSPPVYEYLPHVEVVPVSFNFEHTGSFQNWEKYGNWQYELLKGLDDLPPGEKEKILSLISGINDEKEKIRILYHYLQDETRYINVSIETGGLKPYPASYVTHNKYGDCKALTNYFMAVLEVAGIKSYYAKVYAGNPVRKVKKDFPSQQFNHVILFVPLKNDTIWLDCTGDGAFGYLGTFTQNREAFITELDESRFIKTPALQPTDVLETRRLEISYNYLEDVHVNGQLIYKGESYERFLSLQSSYNESLKSLILRNYIFGEGVELKDYEFVRSHRDSDRVLINYEVDAKHIYRRYGDEILVNTIPFSLQDIEEPGERKLDLQIDYPIYKIDTLKYQIPPAYDLTGELSKYSIDSRFGSYKIEFIEHENLVEVRKSVLIKPGYYSLSDYREFYEFYKKIQSLDTRTYITLQK